MDKRDHERPVGPPDRTKPSGPPPLHLPSTRAFVVRFADHADLATGAVVGRIDHVASGNSSRFYSASELLEFLRLTLAAPVPAALEARTPGTAERDQSRHSSSTFELSQASARASPSARPGDRSASTTKPSTINKGEKP